MSTVIGALEGDVASYRVIKHGQQRYDVERDEGSGFHLIDTYCTEASAIRRMRVQLAVDDEISLDEAKVDARELSSEPRRILH